MIVAILILLAILGIVIYSVLYRVRRLKKEIEKINKKLVSDISDNILLHKAMNEKTNLMVKLLDVLGKQIAFTLNNKPAYNIGDNCGKNLYVTKIELVQNDGVLKYQFTAKNDKTGETKVITD